MAAQFSSYAIKKIPKVTANRILLSHEERNGFGKKLAPYNTLEVMQHVTVLLMSLLHLVEAERITPRRKSGLAPLPEDALYKTVFHY